MSHDVPKSIKSSYCSRAYHTAITASTPYDWQATASTSATTIITITFKFCYHPIKPNSSSSIIEIKRVRCFAHPMIMAGYSSFTVTTLPRLSYLYRQPVAKFLKGSDGIRQNLIDLDAFVILVIESHFFDFHIDFYPSPKHLLLLL